MNVQKPTTSGLLTAKTILFDTGYYDPGDTSVWPSLNPMPSHSPVIATGDQGDPLPDLTGGRSLITVRNDAYKLCGAHFTGGDTQITVELVPAPLPMSTDPGYAEFVELLTPGMRRAASIAR